MLTEKRLLPPVKLYENAQTEGLINNMNKRDMLGISVEDAGAEKSEQQQQKSLALGA